MTDKGPLDDPALDLAAEYALGVLSGEDLRRARDLERTNDRFRAEVARWTGRLSPLLAEVGEVPAPAAVWQTIEKRIGPTASNDNLIELSRRVARWRAIAGGMTAVAASLAAVLFLTLPPGEPAAPPTRHSTTAPMVAILGGQDTGTKVMASWDPGAQQLVLAVSGDLKGDSGHSHELWVIPRGGKPSSLGTMPTGKRMHMRLAETLARLLENGATIAISVEPRGGSPTGIPTGPVIASGALSQA